jgi:hypothetical protein
VARRGWNASQRTGAALPQVRREIAEMSDRVDEPAAELPVEEQDLQP